MCERPENLQPSNQEPPRYVQELKDIRNMLFYGALGSLSGAVGYPLLTGATQSHEEAIVRLAVGFSLGVVFGLPFGRILRL